MICIRNADGSIPDLPPECIEAFGKWFTEQANRCFAHQRKRHAAAAAAMPATVIEGLYRIGGNGHDRGDDRN
jgi:hypothetical protein